MNTAIDKSNMTSLDQFADAIEEALGRDASNKAEWVSIKLDLCELFFKAKMAFNGDNKKFGKWSKENFPKVNEQDRAAYVGMGADIDWAANVLNATERKSMQHIFEKEFKEPKPKVTKGPNKGKTREQVKEEARTATAAAAPKPPLSIKEFAILLMVCHPDSGKNATEKQRNDATAILNKHRDALCGNDADRKAAKAKEKKAKAATQPAQQEPAKEEAAHG